MKYIIDRAPLVCESGFKQTTFLVNEGEIVTSGGHFDHNTEYRMNMDGFVITPSFCVFHPELPEGTFADFRKFFIEECLLKGCSSIITTFVIRRAFEFDAAIKKKRMAMLNSPIDYLLSVQLPIRQITPELIRKCKRHLIPVILAEVEDADELSHVPWGWIREAMHPYHPVLVPVFAGENPGKKKKLARAWVRTMSAEKIRSVETEAVPGKPAGIELLKKSGLYPRRGCLRPGGELSYNLYEAAGKIEESPQFYYDNVRPAVFVQNGRITAWNGEVMFRPGFGCEIEVKKPSLFV